MSAIETTATKRLHVDLTPMVDLGFLLITFFILTTSLQTPVGLKLILPDDSPTSEPPTEVPESKTMSIILTENNFAYYKGNNLHTLQFAPTNSVALRTIIQNHIQQIIRQNGKRNEAIVLIKPTSASSYAQLVNCLDEMTINDIKKYVVMDATKDELISVYNKKPR
jgi:biopolymer transport protein ExbD